MDHTPLVIGLVVLGIVLLLTIIAGGLVIWFIISKLRQHENDISKLTEEGSTTLASINLNDNTRTCRDSAIGVYENFSSGSSQINRPASRRSSATHDIASLTERSQLSLKVKDEQSIEMYENASSGSSQINRPASRRSSATHDIASLTERSQLSLIVKEEQYHVYCERPSYEQILMTAQNYHKSATRSDTVVPTEEVQVVDKVSHRPSAISKVLSKDWMEGLPTSLLLNSESKSFEDMLSFNKGVFIHRTITKAGGSLDVAGVTLVIPPGALEENILITLGIIWDNKYLPTFTRKQAMLSPVVLCQPSGLQFKVPVTLTFPHCAEKITKDWIPQVLKREGQLSEEHGWEPITLADYDERDIMNTQIRLQLHHFTLYALVGQSQPGKTAAKLVHIVAFTGKLQRDLFFKPRLFCLDRYREQLEEVEGLALKFDVSSKMADSTQLLIYDNNEDIMMEVQKLSDDWNLQTDQREVLPFQQVWHSFYPHCTLVMKPKKTHVADIIFEIHAYQNGSHNNKAKLRIAEQIQQSMSPLSSPEDDPVESLIRQLIILLDPENTTGTDSGDWTDLASRMGCNVSKMRWLRTHSSPTRILLDKWFEDKKDLLELEEIMIEINRPDAAGEVRDVINKLSPHLGI